MKSGDEVVGQPERRSGIRGTTVVLCVIAVLLAVVVAPVAYVLNRAQSPQGAVAWVPHPVDGHIIAVDQYGGIFDIDHVQSQSLQDGGDTKLRDAEWAVRTADGTVIVESCNPATEQVHCGDTEDLSAFNPDKPGSESDRQLVIGVHDHL